MERVTAVQNELKVGKGRTNDFGQYKCRNASDIMENVKPLLKKYDLALIISDDLVNVDGSTYIKAEAVLVDALDSASRAAASAYARESIGKKGMDPSQITGSASTYARKYALGGLFLIDDSTTDPDSNEYASRSNGEVRQEHDKSERATELHIKTVRARLEHYGVPEEVFLRACGADRMENVPDQKATWLFSPKGEEWLKFQADKLSRATNETA